MANKITNLVSNIVIGISTMVIVFIVGMLLFWFVLVGGFESPITPWNVLK